MIYATTGIIVIAVIFVKIASPKNIDEASTNKFFLEVLEIFLQ